MQPCEKTLRLPMWNAKPGRKNTESGIGALNAVLQKCADLDSTWNVPTGVR